MIITNLPCVSTFLSIYELNRSVNTAINKTAMLTGFLYFFSCLFHVLYEVKSYRNDGMTE